MKKLKARKKRHVTGQLSIFAILIFQVLFILFAMSLNMALVVHDKINLQNSVDIAAYYGAMKQAEMMNAIAHINYQIRQSWKLLTWRYRVLGSMGLTDSPSSEGGFPAINTDTEHYLPVFKNPPREGPYFFCLGHKLWGTLMDPVDLSPRPGPTLGDNLCERMDQDISAPIGTPSMPGFGGWSSFVGGMSGFITSVGIKLRKKCNFYGFNSWVFGMESFTHFRRDQSARKYMIHELANALSSDKDLDGGFISVGVKKTFKKNLSFINKGSFDDDPNQLKQFNSLTGHSPGEWLKDQELTEWSGMYANTYGPADNCEKKLSYLNDPPQEIKNDPTALAKAQEQIRMAVEFVEPNQPWPACATGSKSCLPSAGMRKIKNFVVFYSVKADLKYKNQIFLPFSTNVTLKAKAFAKPFGGRIGPNTEDPSDPPVDKLLPKSFSVVPIIADKQSTPNYSRYPGDKWGLRSSVVHYHWAKYIKSNSAENNIHYYRNSPEDKGPLAKDFVTRSTHVRARGWEIAAVAPDLFDVTYFTILPYYTQVYFPKVYHLISDKDYVRGDLGRFENSTGGFDGDSILEQVGYGSSPDKSIWARIPSNDFHLPPLPIYSSFAKPFYKIQNLNLLLTGWNPPKRKYESGDNDYDANKETNFGECFKWVHQAGVDPYSPSPRGKIATGCIYGGRTGYSVKMISMGFLQSLVPSLTSVPSGDPEWY